MTVFPGDSHIPQLRQLWKLAFGDTDAFLDVFFESAYSPERCRCVLEKDTVVAALYWFDCECEGRKHAYLYAVATHPEHRGRGLCRQLMADTHVLLKEQGYDGILLVPQEEGLRRMYAAMGYRNGTAVTEHLCKAGKPAALSAVDMETYAKLRRQYLPSGGVIQEGANLRFLGRYAKFYAGDDFVAVVSGSEGIELLGNAAKAPGVLGALGMDSGKFRTPGEELPFAMFLALKRDVPVPKYFGFAFD